jgi:hypothetical protein
MGSISNLGNADAFVAQVRGLDDAHLLAQEISQQGAVHAISTLLAAGCTEDNAVAMLASLREAAGVIRDERKRRGSNPLFETDQTGFQ